MLLHLFDPLRAKVSASNAKALLMVIGLPLVPKCSKTSAGESGLVIRPCFGITWSDGHLGIMCFTAYQYGFFKPEHCLGPANLHPGSHVKGHSPGEDLDLFIQNGFIDLPSFLGLLGK